VTVLRKYQIRWIAERYLRETLKDHAKERKYFTSRPAWNKFIESISLVNTNLAADPVLTDLIKDAVVEYVRADYMARTGKDPDGAA